MSDDDNLNGDDLFDEEEDFDFLDESDDFDTEPSQPESEPQSVTKPQPKASAEKSTAKAAAGNQPPKKLISMIGGGVAVVVVLMVVFSGGDDEPAIVADKTAGSESGTSQTSGDIPEELRQKLAQQSQQQEADLGELVDNQAQQDFSEAAAIPDEMVTDFSQIQEDLFGSGNEQPPGSQGQTAPGIDNQSADMQQPKPKPQPIVAKIDDEKIDDINQDIDANENQINQLRSQLGDIASTLNVVNSSIQNMDTRVLGLSETVDTLSDDLVRVKKIITDEDLDLTADLARQQREQPLMYEAPQYIVHAIIPGRAWLKSTEGQIITITEGDTLGDYGKIAVIDAANGIVLTSSGMAFR